MSPVDIALLIAGGCVAGVVNTLAGGGSLVTVPLLVLIGLPGTLANGTNRIGVLVANLIAMWGFRAHGVSELRSTLPILAPISLGALLGALLATRIDDQTFERVFGWAMLALLIPTLREVRGIRPQRPTRPWPASVSIPVFFAVGVYGGAIQVGIGIVLLFALTRSGFDLVRANAAKVGIIAILTAAAIPVFAWHAQIAWGAAALLATGFAAGGALGSRIAVRGGERVIRPVLAAAVLALAGRMLGLY